MKGMATYEAKGKLREYQYEEKLGDHDVQIEITHCGICHSDVHLIDDDWGMSTYPFVPGHEAVGKIVKLGKHVESLSEGDRVGVGWQSDSCGHCEWCINGEENQCPNQEATCVGRNGGFSDGIIVNERFAIKIPDDMKSEEVAPMMCGGITVYAPLKNIKSSNRVGVIGIGGLGHFAIQFASAMGCEVTAFSRSPEKETEAKELGASEFSTEYPEKGSLDFIINTVPADIDYSKYISALRPNGTFCQVGAAPKPITAEAHSLIGGRISIKGSNIGSPAEIREMLAFAARHNIKAVTENYSLSDVNEAIDKVRKGNAKYRVVLEI